MLCVEPPILKGYSDASWITNKEDLSSTVIVYSCILGKFHFKVFQETDMSIGLEGSRIMG